MKTKIVLTGPPPENGHMNFYDALMTDKTYDKTRFILHFEKYRTFDANGLPIGGRWKPLSWNADFLDSIDDSIGPAIEATGFYTKTKFEFFELIINFNEKDVVDNEYSFRTSKQDGVQTLTIEKKVCWEDNAKNDVQQWRRLILHTVGEMLTQVCKKHKLRNAPIASLLYSKDFEVDTTASISETEDKSEFVEIHFKLNNDDFGGELERMSLISLSDHIESALEDLSLASYDGEEFGGGFFTLFLRTDKPLQTLNEVKNILKDINNVKPASYAVISSEGKKLPLRI